MESGFHKTWRSKKKKVAEHFKIAAGNKDKGILYINNLSANAAARGNLLTTPKDLAKVVNNAVFDHKDFLGTVVFDFPSEDAIRHVIKQNFLKKPNKRRSRKLRQ